MSIPKPTSDDLRTIEQSKASVRNSTSAENAILRDLVIPNNLDFSDCVTLIRQQGSGGCGMMTALIILDILKEREMANSPDFSYGFAQHLYDSPQSQAYHDQLKLLEVYGGCPEAMFHTNYDRGPAPVPSAMQLQAAKTYRIKAHGNAVDHDHGLSVDLIKQYLVKYGPVWAEGALEPGADSDTPWDYHVFAIIGFDDNTREFNILTSYGDQWGLGGFIKCPYANLDPTLWRHMRPTISRVRWVENLPTPLTHAVTGRVRIETKNGRRNLTVRLGVHGKTHMAIWDRNNSYVGVGPTNDWVINCAGIFDESKNLILDFPIRSIPGLQCWPPTSANQWYLEVTDHQVPSANLAGTITEFALVERHLPLGSPARIYRASAQVPFSQGATVRVNLPGIEGYKVTISADKIRIPSGTKVGFNGQLLREYNIGTTVHPEKPVANHVVEIHRVKNDPIAQTIIGEEVGRPRTDPLGNYSLDYIPKDTGDYQTLVAAEDGTVMAVSNMVHVDVV